MGLSKSEIGELKSALTGLEHTHAAIPWSAIPALSRLGADGMRLEIDLRAGRLLGATVIVAAPPRSLKLAGLTRRQRDVADCIVAGQSNKAIARKLGIQLSTVKDHVHAILERTGARSRAELIARTRD